jgi:hypothetical protein
MHSVISSEATSQTHTRHSSDASAPNTCSQAQFEQKPVSNLDQFIVF